MRSRIGLAVGVAAGVAAALAFRRAIASVKQEFKQQLAEIDEIGKFSDRLGIMTESLSALQLQAGLAGVSTKELNTSLRTMLRNIGDAASGTGEAVTTLRELGLSAESLSRLDTGEQFRVIAERISNVNTASGRASAAFRIFGRSGVNMLSALKDGAAGVDAARKRSVELGNSLTRSEAARIEMLNDSVLELKTAWVGLSRQFLIRVAPAFTAIVRAMTESSATSSALGRSVASLGKTFVTSVQVMLDSASLLKRALNGLQFFTTKALQKIAEGLSKINPSSAESQGWKILGEELRTTADDLVESLDQKLLGQKMVADMNAIIEEAKKIGSSWNLSGRQVEVAADRMESSVDAVNASLRTDKIAEFTSAIAEMKSAAVSLFEATRNPAEQFMTRLQRIEELSSAGAIDFDTRRRALDQLAEDAASSDDRAAVERFAQALRGKNDIFFFTLQKAVKAFNAEADKLERSSRLDKMKDAAAAIFEKTRTPMERLRAEYEKLRELFGAGLISRETANRALQQARESLMPEERPTGMSATSENISLSRSALDVRGGRNVDAQERRDTRRNRLLEEIAESVKQRTPATAG